MQLLQKSTDKDDWLHTDVDIHTLDWSDDVTELRHNTKRDVSKFWENSVCFLIPSISLIYMSNGGSGVKILETHVEPRTTAKWT